MQNTIESAWPVFEALSAIQKTTHVIIVPLDVPLEYFFICFIQQWQLVCFYLVLQLLRMLSCSWQQMRNWTIKSSFFFHVLVTDGVHNKSSIPKIQVLNGICPQNSYSEYEHLPMYSPTFISPLQFQSSPFYNSFLSILSFLLDFWYVSYSLWNRGVIERRSILCLDVLSLVVKL